MKIVIPGGTGQLGALLAAAWSARGEEVVVLSRRGGAPPGARGVAWDGKTVGAWAAELDGADTVVNLAGRSVNCRYTEANLAEMMDSRVDSTRAVGQAIAAARRPPRVWLQMSTATIYAHTFGPAHDEAGGVLGGDEPGVPAYWARSIAIAKAWEQTLAEAAVPAATRRVALRTTMVMSSGKDGVFEVLAGLVRKRLGGAAGGGRQFVSWIHGDDFVRALDFLRTREDLSGAVNVASPGPLPHREFMAALRKALGVGLGLPATKWMLELGAWALRTDTELLLKSRRVVPGRLVASGFEFRYPTWPEAAAALAGASV